MFSRALRAHVLLHLTPIASFPALGTGLRVWFLFALNYDCFIAFVGFILIGPMRCGLLLTGFLRQSIKKHKSTPLGGTQTFPSSNIFYFLGRVWRL